MMTGGRVGFWRELAAIGVFAAAASAQTPVRLVPRPRIARKVAALPRIANPDTAGTKINAALAAEDARVKDWAAGCRGKDEQGDEMFWERTVDVTMAGPVFLSLDIEDQEDCGGVHPYYRDFALVYDLRTGELVHWAALLPKGLARDVKTTTAYSDGAWFFAVRSKVLQKLYLAGWKNENTCIEPPIDAEDEEDLALYPDKKAGGLAMMPVNVASVASVCALPIVLSPPTLRRLGLSEDLIAAIVAAGS